MAKVNIKSGNLTPFGGIYFTNLRQLRMESCPKHRQGPKMWSFIMESRLSLKCGVGLPLKGRRLYVEMMTAFH